MKVSPTSPKNSGRSRLPYCRICLLQFFAEVDAGDRQHEKDDRSGDEDEIQCDVAHDSSMLLAMRW
jgi:hypothetical protein